MFSYGLCVFFVMEHYYNGNNNYDYWYIRNKQLF